jgi:hypothetical protein
MAPDLPGEAEPTTKSEQPSSASDIRVDRPDEAFDFSSDWNERISGDQSIRQGNTFDRHGLDHLRHEIRDLVDEGADAEAARWSELLNDPMLDDPGISRWIESDVFEAIMQRSEIDSRGDLTLPDFVEPYLIRLLDEQFGWLSDYRGLINNYGYEGEVLLIMLVYRLKSAPGLFDKHLGYNSLNYDHGFMDHIPSPMLTEHLKSKPDRPDQGDEIPRKAAFSFLQKPWYLQLLIAVAIYAALRVLFPPFQMPKGIAHVIVIGVFYYFLRELIWNRTSNILEFRQCPGRQLQKLVFMFGILLTSIITFELLTYYF